MKLYQGGVSSASWRLRWALALKGILVEHVVLDIEKGEHHAALAGKNPMLQVPTLELDDGRILTETVAIIEWLEETHPAPPLLPRDPVDRARVRSLVQLVNAGIHPLQNTKVKKAVSDDPEAQRAWCARWIARGLAAYEEQVAPNAGRFSFGDTFTMADLFLVPQVRNARRHGADISTCTTVLRIDATCRELPDAKATSPDAVLALDARV
jgi:maleylacetoacetate isomerase